MVQTKRYKKLLTIARSPSAIVLGISLALLALNILFIGRLRPFNSDDLYWQQVVRTWSPFSGHTLYLGTKDIFVEQVPFFALFEYLFPPSRRLLIAETGILTLTSFALFYASSLYFLRKLKVRLTYLTLLPFVWLASFGFPIVQNYLNSDWRAFEVGLSFVTFVLVAEILYRNIKPLRSVWSKILSVGTTALIGILMYSDPYYIFFTIGPILLFVAALYLLKKIDRSKLFILFGGAALSAIFAQLTAMVCTKAGLLIVFDTPSVFISFDSIVTNIVSSLHGLLIVFGADFFGRSAFHPNTAGAMLNAAILAFILYKAYDLRKVLRKPNVRRLTLRELWVVFFAGMIAFVFLVYTATTLVAVDNYRFFIILVYCAVTFLVAILSVSKNQGLRAVVGAFLVGAILFNTTTTFFTKNISEQSNVAGNIGNSQNYEIIRTVQAEGLVKGYASYWHGNVNTYLSSGTVTFLPSLCLPDGNTTPFKWLIDGQQFDRIAQRSFYIIDPDIPQPPICTQDQLIAQFGEPQKILKVYNKSLLVFDYDISSKMR